MASTEEPDHWRWPLVFGSCLPKHSPFDSLLSAVDSEGQIRITDGNQELRPLGSAEAKALRDTLNAFLVRNGEDV